jgi:hypothetical protein
MYELFTPPPNTRFKYMQIVKQSQEAKRCFIHNSGYAIVLGLSRNGKCIRVRRIGRRSITSYHHSFWEECNEHEIGDAIKLNSDMMKGFINCG